MTRENDLPGAKMTSFIHSLSLHDALPIWAANTPCRAPDTILPSATIDTGIGASTRSSISLVYPNSCTIGSATAWIDRKSTRLNSSHVEISYAVFCLKKKIYGRVKTYHHR